jgi:hypothetical protein
VLDLGARRLVGFGEEAWRSALERAV